MSEIEITRLKYPDTIRRNVGMYLSSTDSYTVPLREIINNAEDEFLGKHANLVTILNNNKFKLVTDNGRGIPIYADPEHLDQTILFSTVTDLHAGSKLGDSKEFTSGTHGVGSSAVNAVSDKFIVIRKIFSKDEDRLPEYLKDNGKSYVVLGFERGHLNKNSGRYNLEDLSLFNLNQEAIDHLLNTEFSTAVYLEPDLSIYKSPIADVDTLPLKICLTSNEGKIILDGNEVPKLDFKEDIASGKELIDNKLIDYRFEFGERLFIEGVLAFSQNDFNYSSTALVNLIPNMSGGLHERAVSRAFGQAFNSYFPNVTVGEAKMGLNSFINMFSSYRTSFSSQTKERLVGLGMSWGEYVQIATDKGWTKEYYEDHEVYQEYYFYDQEFIRQLTIFFKNIIRDNRAYFDTINQRILKYKQSLHKLTHQELIASKVVVGNDFKRAASNMSMAKVYEASGHDWKNRELYITEGNSASGGLIKYRDSVNQSILPLRGKTKNSASMQVIDFVQNEELLAIINTIGCGIGEITDPEQSRYGKVIIGTDLDVDGLHISNLITSIFLIHAPEFIKAGKLFKLEAPFYVVDYGKEYYYANEKDKVDFRKHVERRKGLGSYSAEETKRFLVNPKTRRLVQITWPDNAEMEIENARRLLYSASARRDLMERIGIFSEV